MKRRFGRILNGVLLVAMIVGAGITYDMKHTAEMASDRLARLQASISSEKDKISVLKAEWSMLIQPARLQAVVARYADHFDLQPFSADQIASLSDIPEKPLDAKPADMHKALAQAELTNLIRQSERQ
ncbi:MAG: hypothetical protein J0H94_04730 [Rhizobiales bacterium]|jgi:hypothetical protein|nr:hypothetical protein [Hyphomicrobiales bacterium]